MTGKVAVVTGGNGGIGFEMARGLARAGASIAVVGRDAAKSAGAIAELEAIGVRAVAIEADLTESDAHRRMAETTVERLGAIDILVNNAGTNIRKRPEEMSEDEWRIVIDTKVVDEFDLWAPQDPGQKNPLAVHCDTGAAVLQKPGPTCGAARRAGRGGARTLGGGTRHVHLARPAAAPHRGRTGGTGAVGTAA